MSRGELRPDAVVGRQAGPPVSLSIERIVLDGPALSPLQAHQLQGSIERELTRLLHSDRIAPPAGAIARLAAPSLRGGLHTDPARLGIAIARSLHAALGHRE